MISACHAGYLLPALHDVLIVSELIGNDALRELWRSLCVAERESTIDLYGRKLSEDPVLLTAANFVSRGQPTLPSVALEKIFAEEFHSSMMEEDDQGVLRSCLINPGKDFLLLLLRALRAVAIPMDEGLLATAEGKEALQLIHSPIGVAWVQRTLIQVLMAGGLDLAAPSWSIAVIERDIPCSALGIGEFQYLLRTLFTLEGKGRTVPEISATVVPSKAFADSKLHLRKGVRVVGEGAAIPGCDVLLDVATLHRSGAVLPEFKSEAKVRVVLRGAPAVAEPRRFHLTEILSWKSLTMKGSREFDPEVLAAVQSLLADAFRIGRPGAGQLQLLNEVLLHHSFIAALPAMAGKSLLYQFAGLLQPALSFAIFPLAALASDQREQFDSFFIDGVECLHEGLGMEARQKALDRFRNHQALFLLITAELFRTEDVDQLLESIRKERGYFAQCVIDEAQCMSDWSHDPRPLLARAPAFALDRMNAGKKKLVAVRLLTASLSRDVIADLRLQLAGLGRGWSLENEQCVVGTRVLRPQQQFQLVALPVRSPDTPANLIARQNGATDALKAQREAFAVRHQMVPESMRIPGYDASTVLPTVLYCPYSSGTLGVTNRYSADISNSAMDEVLNLPEHGIGTFIGKDDGQRQVGRQGVVDAIEQQGLFHRGARSLLISTRAYGIGSHKPDIHCTMHMLAPPGVEHLVQECARAGRDGKLSLHTVLYGEVAQGAESPDLLVGRSMLAAAASDAAREKQLIHDLMQEISFPEDSNTNRVANMIADEYGDSPRISYWQRGLEERMYAHHEGNAFGYIDLVTQAIVPEPEYHDQERARAILEYAFAVSIEAAGSGPSLSSWVAATFAADVDDGIARQIQDFDPGAVFTLRVGFENDREPLLNQIHQLLWRNAEIEIQRKVLSDVHGYDWSEFREQLVLRVGRSDLFAALDPGIEDRLVRIYNKIRTRRDTERILFRLASLGVLHDYKAHPASRKYSLRIAVRADHEIRSALEQYLGLFMTERQVDRKMASLFTYPGDTLLEHCLYFLVDFSYEHCHARRIESARMMDMLCRTANKQAEDDFGKNIEKALSAKYALPSALPAELSNITDRLDLLAKYMELLEADRSASVRENTEQLRASCALLLSSFPDEPALQLLRSFAELVNAGDDNTRNSIQKEFATEFGRSASASGLQGERYLAVITDFDSRFRRFFDDQTVALLLSLLHDEVKRVKSMPLPAAVSVETLTATKQVAAKLAAERKAAEKKVAEQKVAEQKAAEQKAAEQKAAEQKAAEQKAAEQKAAEQKAAEQKAAEQKAAEQRAAEQKAAEQKAAEQKAAEQKATQQSEHAPKQGPSTGSIPPGGRDELDHLLAEIDGILLDSDSPESGRIEKTAHGDSGEQTGRPKETAVRSAAQAQAPAPDRTPVSTPVDPILLKHLKWLQTFNNSFLKHYES